MSPYQVQLLQERYHRLAGGGLGSARRRQIASRTVRRLAWRSRIWLAAHLKRGVDVVGAAAALTLGAPLFATIALAIKLDSRGPVFYSQERIGRDGRLFQAWKFRSMVLGADEVLQAYLERNPALRDEWKRAKALHGGTDRFVFVRCVPAVTGGRAKRLFSIRCGNAGFRAVGDSCRVGK